MLKISAGVLRANIVMFFNALMQLKNGIHEPWDIKTFDLNQHENIKGHLTIAEPRVTVTMEPYEMFTFATVKENDEGNLWACVNNVTFPTFKVTFEYEADFVVNEDTPIYGNGKYKGELADVSTTFCWLLQKDESEILDFNIDVTFRHRPSYLSNFYMNPELDPIISSCLTLLKRIYAMWNSYEPECSSKCVLNPLFYYVLNYVLYDIDKSTDLTLENCECLKEVLEDFTLEIDSLNDYETKELLQKIVLMVKNY